MPAAGQGEPRAGGWLQVSSGSRAVVKRCPRRCRYSLLWEEILGFPMYLRMGLRFLSSMASFSFFALLLCWDTREECWCHPDLGRGQHHPRGLPASQPAPPPTFLALGKKGSHLSLSGRACAFSLALATRGSRLRMPVWFMYVLRAKAMGELEESRA